MITDIGTWAIIGTNYTMCILAGLSIGIMVQLYQRKKEEKQIRRELFEEIASNNPYTMTILETYKEAHKNGRDTK